jgi:hypothetical protein
MNPRGHPYLRCEFKRQDLDVLILADSTTDHESSILTCSNCLCNPSQISLPSDSIILDLLKEFIAYDFILSSNYDPSHTTMHTRNPSDLNVVIMMGSARPFCCIAIHCSVI